jgi:ribosomal-protein-alanine N-acetyltransferase
MQLDDLDEVIKIEQEAFTDAWLIELFAMELAHDAYVAVSNAQIVGYICAWRVLDECTITNIACKADLKRKGIARFMFSELFRVMDAADVLYYYLEVRISNISARALYQKLGFTEIGIRKSYYHDPVEDAVVMSMEKDKYCNG